MEINEYVKEIEITRKGLEITLVNGFRKHISDQLDVWVLYNEVERMKNKG
jgi:hypothetical protein